MNGGDSFFNEKSVENIVKGIDNFHDVYFGRGLVMSDNNRWIRPNLKLTTQKEIERWLQKEMPVHQALFIPKYLYKKEQFDTKYCIFADAEHQTRLRQQTDYLFIDTIVCRFALGGVSSNYDKYKNVWQMSKEALCIGKKHHTLLHSFKRIVIYHIKYIMTQLFGEESFLKIVKKVKYAENIDEK